jgi:3-oxoacyl-(acyl-carrier-protein) synthase
MQDGKIGPAKNCDRPFDGCKLNLSNQPRSCAIRYALCCSYSFGGQAAAIVVKNRRAG